MNTYSEYIHLSRYARYLPEKKRRETWEETIDRYFNFFENHLEKHFNWQINQFEIKSELKEAILNMEIMPSMRCLMTAGKALEKENLAGYNCCYVAIDKVKSFDEILYLLMNGGGVGFSVERQYINLLPDLPEELHPTETIIVVHDSKKGWAKAFRELMNLLYSGLVPKWDMSKVRPAGSVLKTFGGRASGPEPLEDLFNFVVNKFTNTVNNNSRKLNSLECHDIVCKVAESVVVGGVRRCNYYKYKVKTNDGWKQISKIKIGDKVIFNDEEIKVTNVFDNGVQQTMNISMEDGTNHICTPEHRWFVYNHKTLTTEWVQTKNLKNGKYSMLKPKSINNKTNL